MKKFKILDGNDSDVLGGVVSEDNVFISVYGGDIIEGKLPADLEIGESCRRRYNMSPGRKQAVYKILRVQ